MSAQNTTVYPRRDVHVFRNGNASSNVSPAIAQLLLEGDEFTAVQLNLLIGESGQAQATFAVSGLTLDCVDTSVHHIRTLALVAIPWAVTIASEQPQAGHKHSSHAVVSPPSLDPAFSARRRGSPLEGHAAWVQVLGVQLVGGGLHLALHTNNDWAARSAALLLTETLLFYSRPAEGGLQGWDPSALDVVFDQISRRVQPNPAEHGTSWQGTFGRWWEAAERAGYQFAPPDGSGALRLILYRGNDEVPLRLRPNLDPTGQQWVEISALVVLQNPQDVSSTAAHLFHSYSRPATRLAYDSGPGDSGLWVSTDVPITCVHMLESLIRIVLDRRAVALDSVWSADQSDGRSGPGSG